MTVQINRIKFSDTDKVSHIKVTGDQSRFVDRPEQVLSITRELLLEDTVFPFTVTADSLTIGFFTLNFFSLAGIHYLKSERECGIQSLVVDCDHQQKGYGRETIRAAVKYINENHPDINLLKLTVNLRNKAAKSLYLNCGFTDTGEEYLGGPSGPQHIYSLTLKKELTAIKA